MKTATHWLGALDETTAFLKPYADAGPAVGIVLGTGLGALLARMDIRHTISYDAIPHFPQATVEFHKGALHFGAIGSTPVIAMQGRFHFYEGYSAQEITFPIRVLHRLGVTALFLSNAAGGIRADLKKGNLVLLDDHINLQTDNPLRGLDSDAFGPRFPDMSRPYDPHLSRLLAEEGARQGVKFTTGVYASVIGPNLETRAEYRFLRIIGADCVGMSTVPEVIVAAQLGLPCTAVSVITDECDPDNLKPVDIAEIITVAGKADEKLSAVLAAVIAGLGVGR